MAKFKFDDPRPVFLNSPPYIVNQELATDKGLIFTDDRYIDHMRTDDAEIQARLIRFALDLNLITQTDDTFELSHKPDVGSIDWLMSWYSFRAMSSERERESIIATISRNSGIFLNKLIELNLRLDTVYDEVFLNTLCNRTMRAVIKIPFEDIPLEEHYQRWSDIHTEYPFLWVLIRLQSVARLNSTEVNM